ncbi:EF-hand domain-containing protein [Ruegeria marina]|uniref:EF hand n=1 Tax=Ruegeria marina TaxID=639004 RepID=A0A1G7FP48_9RHOB|nr:EF-hand domain-containing protein [Ruegeria marina]SDE77644.1 EF hand [Ruegeria marina]
MKMFTTLATALSFSIAAAGHATAESDHGHGGGPLSKDSGPSASQGEMMHEMMRKMMPMMMQMHGRMMGAGHGSGMSMMDSDMMRMMMGPKMIGAGPVAEPEPGAARTAMLARLAEFDADGDGTLSLAEFEVLHAAMIRETTVDRFQHLDADGDGRITEEEMGAPAKRMEMLRGMPGAPGMMGDRMPSGN